MASKVCHTLTILFRAEYFNSVNATSLRIVKLGTYGSWKVLNFIVTFSRTRKSWNKATGPGKFWKYVKLKADSEENKH